MDKGRYCKYSTKIVTVLALPCHKTTSMYFQFNNHLIIKFYSFVSDSPFLSERQAKTFTNGGRRRTGKIVTECCDNYCNLQIIESYCAPLPQVQEGPSKPIRHAFLHERERLNEQNNRVEELPPPPPPHPEHEDEPPPDVSQELIFSDHDYESMLDSDINLVNNAQLMVADQAPDTTEENTEELLHKDKGVVIKSGTNTTQIETRDEVDVEEMVSENRDKNLSGKTKGNPRTQSRPASRERKGKRRNSKEKKRNKTKSGSKERRERRKKNKSKNKKNRRKKNRHGQEEFTQPTGQLITDIEVLHPQARVRYTILVIVHG